MHYEGPSVIYGSKNTKYDHVIYSDRMYRLNHEKMDKLVKKHLNKGQMELFDGVNISDVENLLNEYLNYKDVKVVMIEKDINVSNGFPYWVVCYNGGNK